MVSEESKKRMSESAKLRCTEEWRNKTSDRMRVKIDDAMLISLYTAGNSQEECALSLGVTRKIISNAMKRLGIQARKAAKRNQWGENNSSWKGQSANLVCKHKRLYRAFGQPSRCDVCGTTDPSKSYDWANLSGDYDNPLDFKRMCRSCHWKYDKKHLNFNGGKGDKKCGS